MLFQRIILVFYIFAFSLVPLFASASGESQVVAEAELKRVVEDFLRQRTATLGVDLNIKKIVYSGDLVLPQGMVEYEVKAANHWEGWGNATLAVYVRVDGQLKRNISVKVEVEALAEMVVAARQMEIGEVIGRQDVVLQKRDLSTAGKICRNIDDVVGKRLKSAVRGNLPLRSDQLERVPLVKSGQLVTILLENPQLRLTASGRCKGAGAVGEMITVQNLASKKDISARVVDAVTVRVEF